MADTTDLDVVKKSLGFDVIPTSIDIRSKKSSGLPWIFKVFFTRLMLSTCPLRNRAPEELHNFPSSIYSKLGLSSLRVYAQAKNAFTFTDYTGYDPEISNGGGPVLDTGVDRGTYPSPRIISLGLNLKF